MFGRPKPQVLVAGAGPVGLFAALNLVERGVKVRIIDSEWRHAAHSYALALHPRSLMLLEEVGLLGTVMDAAYRVRRVGFYDRGGRRAELPLDGIVEDFPYVAVLPQAQLEAALEAALRRHGVEVEWNHRLARVEPGADGVQVRIDKMVKESMGYGVAHTEWAVARSRELEVPLLFGADGHRSLVRRALDIPFEETSPTRSFAVFEFRTDFDPDHELRIVFDGDSGNVLWPMPGGWVRWSFELPEEAHPDSREKGRVALQLGAERFPLVEKGRLWHLLEERAPWFAGEVQELRWRMIVRFENRIARSFGRGRVWLAGDAGHMTSPVAAQSMNVGLAEARDLAARYAAVLAGESGLDLLDAYGRERRAEWRFLLGQAGRLAAGEGAEPFLVRHADRLISSLPAAGADLDALVARLGFLAEHFEVAA